MWRLNTDQCAVKNTSETKIEAKASKTTLSYMSNIGCREKKQAEESKKNNLVLNVYLKANYHQKQWLLMLGYF